MHSQFSSIRTRITSFLSGDVELEQAFVRCTIVLLVALYLWTYPNEGGISAGSPRVVALVYLAISIPAFLLILARPGLHHPRRITFTVLDQLMISYGAFFGGHAVPIIAITFWVIIGSGFRFGRTYLYLSAGIGLLGIIYNMAFSPHWSGYYFVGWGFILAILIVTFYTKALLGRATETNRKLNESLTYLNNLAHIDTLTGQPNRLALVERLTQSIAMSKRSNTYLSLLYFDLDVFKAVNDSFGHHRGMRC